MALESLSPTDISNLLAPHSTLAKDLDIILEENLDSTNDYLMSLIATQSPASKVLVLAETQSSGKGRDGRNWVSPPGNIYMSLYWPFKCALEQLYGLSLVVGVAVARVLKANGLSDVKLKWPNDIFWQQRKMGGILIETKQRSGNVDAVIGLGLNISDMQAYTMQISQKFVVLEDALQRKVYRNKLIAQLLAELDQILNQFAEHGLDLFVEEWKNFDMNSGQNGINDKILIGAKNV